MMSPALDSTKVQHERHGLSHKMPRNRHQREIMVSHINSASKAAHDLDPQVPLLWRTPPRAAAMVAVGMVATIIFGVNVWLATPASNSSVSAAAKPPLSESGNTQVPNQQLESLPATPAGVELAEPRATQTPPKKAPATTPKVDKPPKPVPPETVSVANSIEQSAPEQPMPPKPDDIYNARIKQECSEGVVGIFFREKTRFSVCEDKWTREDIAGHTVCKLSSQQTTP